MAGVSTWIQRLFGANVEESPPSKTRRARLAETADQLELIDIFELPAIVAGRQLTADTAANGLFTISDELLQENIDTLALAYASAGDFNSAVKYEKQAIDSGRFTPDELKYAQSRLAFYQRQQGH